ncbi:MAG: hypothetical protein WDM92_07615 [Caulobacteraceae bacterium]
MPKAEIIERLGESAVLLPGLIAEALDANDRLKLRLTLLQEAAAHAADPSASPRAFDAERRAAGLDDPRLDALISGARAAGGTRIAAPGVGLLVGGIGADLAAMLSPLQAAQASLAEALAKRVEAARAAVPACADDELETAEVAAMTSARHGGRDSVHRLVMDLHKAINQLAAETAVETIAGAKVHHLADGDRARVRAFMAGLNRTAPLAFGHPGLGTTAARTGPRLTIQNDIGETDAHVLVVHVEGVAVTVTYTDVHRRRARFFMGLFGDRMAWSQLAEQAADGLGDDERFYLVTGRFEGADEAAVDALLEFLGSRIVFLIDWNKARKALQTFVERDAAVALLAWAAAQDLGHRGFLELGGPDLVFDAVRRAAAGRVPYGVRLDGALGAAETTAFLRRVLRETSEGMTAGRSARLIRDEIQADLAARFETAESAILAILVRHLGLSRTLAGAAAGMLAPGGPAGLDARAALARRAKRLEAKADQLTVQAREVCARLQDAQSMRRLADSVENAMDALDECAFLISLAAPGAPAPSEELRRLSDIVVEAIGQLVRAVEAAVRLPDGRRIDAAAALQAIDAATQAERDADAAERASVGALMQAAQPDARVLTLGLEVTRALETTTDHIAHAALALRERVLEDLSA